ncbi:MAG: Holliday junction branch migration protein RuvA [Dehalococcoidia bacterium]|nr:Holliday junction branch migration protein RuvA [Dehalococcoidia bacterium]MCK4262757.1 Holliday junction branch migration protein RuvA [Dehalococcoidia bacterium]
MIATLEGTLEYRGSDSIVIAVGGVGFQVSVPGSTLAQLGTVSDRISLHIHLHLREDNISLYGFASYEELGLFKNLISVSGIGPKVALALLSFLNADQMVVAITTGNVDVISQVPGVGRKMASRLVVELGEKLEKEWKGTVLPSGIGNEDVVAALTSLGYSLKEANKAVASMTDASELGLEERVKLALQQLVT